jgi:2-haloacid dehalogenase
MENLEVLRREIKALAFDQYGTIVDMQKGLTEAVTPFLKRRVGTASRIASSPGGAARTSRIR